MGLLSRRRSWIRAAVESRTTSALLRHLVLLCFSFECRSIPESQEAVSHWITPFGGFRKQSSSNWATGPGFCQRVFAATFGSSPNRHATFGCYFDTPTFHFVNELIQIFKKIYTYFIFLSPAGHP